MSKINDRLSIVYQIKHALHHPDRIYGFLKRFIRTHRLKKEADGNFLKFYAGVVDDDAIKISPNRAIGSNDQQHYLTVGEMQFNYLLKHGLKKK